MKRFAFLRYLLATAVLATAALLLFRFGTNDGGTDAASYEAAEHIPTVIRYAEGRIRKNKLHFSSRPSVTQLPIIANMSANLSSSEMLKNRCRPTQGLVIHRGF